MALILAFRIRIPNWRQITKIFEYIVQVSSFALIITYFCLIETNFSKIFTILFTFFLPAFYYALVSFVAVYQSLPTALLLVFEASIICTNRSAYIIVICAFYIIFHIIIYALNTKVNKVVLEIEINRVYISCNLYYTIFLMVYGIIMLFMINDDTIQGILAEIEVWIVLFILYFEIAQFSDYRQAFAKKAASLLALIFGCAVSFFCNILAFNILTPILCFLVPTVFEFVYLYLKLEQRSGKILNSYNDFVFEDDLYELNWNNRTAFLVKKGKQNDLIRSHIFCDNVWLMSIVSMIIV